MQLNTISQPAEITLLANEWNGLLKDSASPVPFLKPEYLTAWWQHLGAGEWVDATMRVVVVRQEDGSLLGIAPLFQAKNPEGESALMFIGSFEISDYLDFIVRKEDLNIFLDALLDYLTTPEHPEWDSLDLYNILDDSPTLPALEKISTERGWQYQQTQLQPAPRISLPDTWEGYLASLKKKQRHELRRKMRKAANHVPPVDWYIVEDEQDLEEHLDILFSLMLLDPGKKEFLNELMQTQIRAIVQSAFQNNWLQMAVLQVGNTKAAIQVSFDYDNRIWGYNSGVDIQELSSGVVLLGHILQKAIADGRVVFDFMRGDEQYKYRFGAVNRFVVRATVRKS